MAKSIIKEIIIILLLLLAVVLALGVLFYDYIPTNKMVPKVETYKTADSVSKEIEESVTEKEPTIERYEINETHLSEYQKTNVYNKGKVNPFSTYADPTPDPNAVNNNGMSGTNSMNTNVPKSNSSGNTFYQNTGTK